MPASVLVVDDDPAFRELAARMLAAMGFVIAGEAATAAAATVAAADVRPDAALVDVFLPDGDGRALATALVALPSPPTVVLTSSNRDAVTPARARAAGAAGFVAKADLPNDLLRRLLIGAAA